MTQTAAIFAIPFSFKLDITVADKQTFVSHPPLMKKKKEIQQTKAESWRHTTQILFHPKNCKLRTTILWLCDDEERISENVLVCDFSEHSETANQQCPKRPTPRPRFTFNLPSGVTKIYNSKIASHRPPVCWLGLTRWDGLFRFVGMSLQHIRTRIIVQKGM